jgi:hypothetical protein
MAKVVWTQRQDLGPQARSNHAVVYDTGHKRTLLFGGELADGGLAADTWEWDGDYWTQVADTGPDARSGHAMAYTDPTVVLFGGATAEQQCQDTWIWEGAEWTQAADTGPSARVGHALAYDTARKRVILFGGQVADAVAADTWEWDALAWTQVEDSGPPSRRGHAMAYDPLRQRVVLFGGDDKDVAMRDTWEWDGAVWVPVQDIGPYSRTGAAMTFDGAYVLLFGGVSTPTGGPPGPVLARDSWEWPGDFWTQRADIGPSARWGARMALDSDRGRVVLFGGCTKPPAEKDYAGFALADTWEAPFDAVAAPKAAGLSSFTVEPASVVTRDPVTYTVRLAGVAGADTIVDIRCDHTTGFTITVPAGEALASVDQDADLSAGIYTFQASLDSDTRTATLAVKTP